MQDSKLDTPVVFLIFNRPYTTERVFEQIRKAKPSRLLVVADGPREEIPDDIDQCKATRKILETIDWDCEITTNYSDVNLGCKHRVSSGLDWAFDLVDEAIILEDDCVPDISFFQFCQELLKHYRFNDRIAVISGQNVQFRGRRTDYSYYFSRYPPCWGWATWKRAWQHFDFDMKLWPVVRDGGWLKDILGKKRYVDYWTKIFQSTYEGKIDSWSYRWIFTCWINNYLSIISNTNLITNIGFGLDATNTTNRKANFLAFKSESTNFPLRHQPVIIRDTWSDEIVEKFYYSKSKKSKYEVIIKNLVKNSVLKKINCSTKKILNTNANKN